MAAELCTYPFVKTHVKVKIKDVEGLTNVDAEKTLAFAPVTFQCIFTPKSQTRFQGSGEEALKLEGHCTTRWGSKVSIRRINGIVALSFLDRNSINVSLSDYPAVEESTFCKGRYSSFCDRFNNASESITADCGSLRTGSWLHTKIIRDRRPTLTYEITFGVTGNAGGLPKLETTEREMIWDATRSFLIGEPANMKIGRAHV